MDILQFYNQYILFRQGYQLYQLVASTCHAIKNKIENIQ